MYVCVYIYIYIYIYIMKIYTLLQSVKHQGVRREGEWRDRGYCSSVGFEVSKVSDKEVSINYDFICLSEYLFVSVFVFLLAAEWMTLKLHLNHLFLSNHTTHL